MCAFLVRNFPKTAVIHSVSSEAGILCSVMAEKIFITESQTATEQQAEQIGARLRGGEVIELISDLGGGKTAFTRGLARGFGSRDHVASPSFTISYVYGRPDGKQLHHFDFYRLSDAGIVGTELAEVQADPDTVVVVEWGEVVHDVLPEQRLVITIKRIGETNREFICRYPEELGYLFADID